MDEILFSRHRPRPTQSADTLPLFSGEPEGVEPTWLSNPTSSLEQRFAAFHHANPAVFIAIEKKALQLLDSGRTRIGIAELVEDLRYDNSLKTSGDQFKLNNSYRSFYARLLISQHSKLASVIGTREQT